MIRNCLGDLVGGSGRRKEITGLKQVIKTCRFLIFFFVIIVKRKLSSFLSYKKMKTHWFTATERFVSSLFLYSATKRQLVFGLANFGAPFIRVSEEENFFIGICFS